MSPTATAPEQRAAKAWYQHPVVGLLLAPFVVPVAAGILSVWVTQARTTDRISVVETQQQQQTRQMEANRADRQQQFEALRKEVVPRAEHEARWKAFDEKLDVIQRQGAHANERVDKIYDLMIGRGK